MGSEDEQVKAVFAAALERPSGGRSAWLARVCRGNAALRARVETLLDAHERAGAFMEDKRSASPADAAPAAPAVPEEQPGAVIGHYKLLQKIGEGGFGSVYMAEQMEPVVRRVALKVIKLGMDTKQVVARFEAERQALAMMDHPNIAKVLDAGATASGRPYFVMELVRGVPITEYCDTANLPTTQRLELFAQVCGALQHAHQKGVIHRDVKPGNVLVTLHDGVPVPKVIDFGIAKAIDRRLTEKTLFTEFRQVIGTPEYMSPEQAENSGLDIDTRADVYSLGVLLYELLTATTPFDAATLREKGYGEMLRVIREDDPPPPSTRIATLGDRLAVIARLHGVAPELFSRRLRGDLDWIVMKCLEKDRARRYETASGLAADIKRHLNDEPVTAGPQGAGYRWRKFVRRNRAQVAAAGVVLAVLVLGVVGTTFGMMRALREKGRADEETARANSSARAEAIARVAAQENEQKAVAETKRAEDAKEEEAAARRRAETISGFVTTALKTSDPENAGGGQAMTILAAMDNAVADIDSGRFADDPATEAGLKMVIGAILFNNGRLADAEALLTQALSTGRRLSPGHHEDLPWGTSMLGATKRDLGKMEEARELFRQALEMDRRLLPADDERVADGLANLASVLAPDEAEPLLREALAMDRRLFGDDSPRIARTLGILASKLYVAGRHEEAEPLFEQALAATQRAQPGDNPHLAAALDDLGKVRQALGRGAEAVELFRKSLEMTKRIYKGPHPATVTGLNNLAFALTGDGRLAEAAQLEAEALEMERRIPPGDGPRVADALDRLASALLELGRSKEAEPLTAEALGIRRRLHPGDDPSVAATLAQRGAALEAVGRVAEAGPLLTEAMDMYRRLAPKDSPEIAQGLDNLGKTLETVGRLDAAVALLTQALAMRERLYQGDDLDLAKGLNNLAWMLFKSGRHAEAEQTARRALDMNRRLFHGDHPQLAQTLMNLAVLLKNTGRPAEAEPLAAQAVAMYERFFQGDDLGVARAKLVLGGTWMAMGRVADSVAQQEAALRMFRKLLPAGHPDVLRCMTEIGTGYYMAGAFDEAIPLFEEALKSQEATLGREHPATLMTMANLGANYVSAGRFAEALPLLEAVRSQLEQYPQLDFVNLHLLNAYVHLADPAKAGDTGRALAFAEELVGASRATMPEGSPELAPSLVTVGLYLNDLKEWARAEPLLREGLAIRERWQPDAWTTFNTKSLLGDALLGQRKYAEAEPLLLAGYRGLLEREATNPAIGRVRIRPALERLVRLYEATGNAAEAAAWRKVLESRQPADGGRR
jgi:serine/threonine protein kinase/tetratricopeptide (TPR) repeat protein